MDLIGYGLITMGYLLGSVSAAIITCKLMGLPDPRTQGSKNPGATNVLRFGGKKAAAITLVGDSLKGLLPVLLARLVTDDATTLVLVGLAAFLGHLYPLFFGFKGGKGVATAFGAIIGLSWPVALAAVGTWLVMAYGLKVSSLSALTAATLTPLYFYFLEEPTIFWQISIIMSALLIWRHRSNIKNLISGKEEKIQSKD